MTALFRYFHTIRHLKSIQLAARLWVHFPRSAADTRAPPPRRTLAGPYAPVITPEPSLIAPDTFRFLSVECACRAAADWRGTQVSKLWLYNLHYFDDLNAREDTARTTWHRALLERWVAQNPPSSTVGWEPYPVSRRMVNWIKWSARGNELPAICIGSLAVQARWLAKRVEYHILGNHLLSNAKALIHAGIYFSGAEADSWYRQGLRLLERELPEQVLPDGGHFERSTMYHAAALEDLLDLINILDADGREPPAEWVSIASRMFRWLGVMTHPDGQLAFFNDAAFGVAPEATELAAYARRLKLAPQSALPEALTVLQPSGYVRAMQGAAWLACDCAPIGPDYLPGHAHADTLSFELSLGYHRVVVNSGTSQYGSDPERQRQRGTAAHNTIVVNGLDSSEVWGGFRVARRARVRMIRALEGPSGVVIEASHDGFKRISRECVHTRNWTLGAHSLCIEDRVSGAFRSAEAYFHFHPEVRVRKASDHEVRLEAGEYLVRVSFTGAQSVEILPGTWHPRFGESIPNAHLRVMIHGGQLETLLRWDAEG